MSWTRDELIEQFAPALAEQQKLHDPVKEWERGFEMFPNHICGKYRLVIGFDYGFVPRGNQEREIDPRPRPWIIGFKLENDDKPTTIGSWLSGNWFETYEEAVEQFKSYVNRISFAIDESGITSESPRQGKCTSCGTIQTWDADKGYSGMVTLAPHLQFDALYDGCRGWD